MSGHGPGVLADEWAACERDVLRALRRLRALASGGPVAGSPPAPFAPVDVVHGSHGVWQAFWLHADVASSPSIDAIVPDLRPLSDVLDGSTAAEWEELRALLLDGRLTVRLILPRAAVAAAPTRAFVGELAGAGIDVRTSDDSSWFFVSRDRVAVVPLDWAAAGDVDAAVVRGGPLVPALTSLFEHRWRAAHPWLEDEHHAVLRLLAAGRTDDEAAAESGVSVRTVRRRVAEAMDRYGARTRFELGWRYASTG